MAKNYANEFMNINNNNNNNLYFRHMVHRNFNYQEKKFKKINEITGKPNIIYRD